MHPQFVKGIQFDGDLPLQGLQMQVNLHQFARHPVEDAEVYAGDFDPQDCFRGYWVD
jgi:hypothetical protein